MVDVPNFPARSSGRHRPWLAALLSFILPGLGQAYAGRARPAVLFAVPVLLLGSFAALVLTGAVGGLRNTLLSSDVLAGVLVANVLLFVWRAISVWHAGLTPGDVAHADRRRVALATVIILLVITAAMHAWVGVVVARLDDTLTQIFATPAARADPALPQPTDAVGGAAPGTVAVELGYRWDGTERINVLLLGTDDAPGREAVLTDVILVVSVDPVAQTAVMVSVPRDTGFVPLPDTSLFPDGFFPEKINALATRASLDPETWCPDLADDPEACGLRTIRESVGLYLGIGIHHFALVDMAGFAEMIDAVGGVDLCLPGRLVDPEFDGSLSNRARGERLVLPAGCHHYNGLDALAYARSRKGWIEMPDGTKDWQSDFARSERQQLLLLALRRELAEADTLFELPALLSAIGRTVSTDFPREQAGDLASLLPLIAGPDIERVVLGYPEFVDAPTAPEFNYMLLPKRDAIRDEMARLFGADALEGWYLGMESGPEAPEADAPSP
jgi:LCP family protein required for cell wall assembly